MKSCAWVALAVLAGCAHQRSAGWVDEPLGARVPASGALEPTTQTPEALRRAGWARVGWAYVSSTSDSFEAVCADAEALARAHGGGKIRRHDFTRQSTVHTSVSAPALKFGWVTTQSQNATPLTYAVTHARCFLEVFRAAPDVARAQPEEKSTFDPNAVPCAAARAAGIACDPDRSWVASDGSADTHGAACTRGDSAACVARGMLHYFAEEPAEAKVWYRRACALENPVGCEDLAHTVKKYDWVPLPAADRAAFEARARALWNRACAQGDLRACDRADWPVQYQTLIGLCRAGERAQWSEPPARRPIAPRNRPCSRPPASKARDSRANGSDCCSSNRPGTRAAVASTARAALSSSPPFASSPLKRTARRGSSLGRCPF